MWLCLKGLTIYSPFFGSGLLLFNYINLLNIHGVFKNNLYLQCYDSQLQ